jgi:ribonuclease R
MGKQTVGPQGRWKEKEKERTFVYRVHDRPDEEKLRSFSLFVKKFGYQMHMGSHKKISESLNQLMKEIQGKRSRISWKIWRLGLWPKRNIPRKI